MLIWLQRLALLALLAQGLRAMELSHSSLHRVGFVGCANTLHRCHMTTSEDAKGGTVKVRKLLKK
jgi:hypothetical protein